MALGELGAEVIRLQILVAENCHIYVGQSLLCRNIAGIEPVGASSDLLAAETLRE